MIVKMIQNLENKMELQKNSLEIIQSEVSQKEKHQYSILTHIYGISKDGSDDPVSVSKKTQMCIADFWTQRERERVG